MTSPTVSDFVNSCWQRAKIEMLELDPDFVSKVETEVRLSNIGLVSPWTTTPKSRPKLQLSKKWHQLLESCLELEMQVNCLKTAAALLRPTEYTGKTVEFTGQSAVYNWRSWFVHALTLAERSESVITKTEQLGLTTKELAKRALERVNKDIKMRVNKQRQDYVHGFRRSWASGITEDQLWELSVSIGLTPDLLLKDFVYEEESRRLEGNKYLIVEEWTQGILDLLGAIFHDLQVEADAATKPAIE